MRRPNTHVDMNGQGIAYGLAAFLWWGCVVFYFKAVSHVSPLEVLAHRIIWSGVLLVGILMFQRRLGSTFRALRDRQTLTTLLCTTILITFNWYLFIWAVTNDHVLQSSLGYFINPLVNVLLGRLFLGEKLRRIQIGSVILATTGVAWMILGLGEIPFIAISLALSFGIYGLLRKKAKVDAVQGLAIETLLLVPASVICLIYLGDKGELVFGARDINMDLLLVAAGIVTALPLIWFVEASRRLRLSTIGFMQYMTPTCHFLFAVLVYRESFTRVDLAGFMFIWSALALFTLDSIRMQKKRSRP